MSRILICWELGGNLGHVMRLLPIARILREEGHAVSWAFDETRCAAWQLVSAEGFVCETAAGGSLQPDSYHLSLNYSQNLLKNGYRHGDGLKSRLQAWRSRFLSTRPDMILAEHAPTPLLVARSMNIPRAVTGTGFSIPPLTTPMPSLHPWMAIPEQTLANKEAEFLDAVNPVLGAAEYSPLLSVADIFTGAERILCSWPEFDHYSGRSDPLYFGPVIESVSGAVADWPSSGRDNIFIYMGFRNRNLLPLLAVLERLGLPVFAVTPGITADEGRALSRPSIRIASSPVNLEDAGDHCCFAITEAGHNTTALLLLAAVPLLLVPSQLEQQLLAYRLASQGLGSMISMFDTTPDIESKIRGVMSDSAMRNHIGALVQNHAHSDNSMRIRMVAEKCSSLVKG